MKPLIFGHRGSPFKAPENTIASINKAIEDGCEAVEIDLRKTKDGKLVVIHDAKVDRTTNGKGFVKDFTLEELKKLDSYGEKIPTFEEAINFVNKRTKIIVEIKEENIEKDIVGMIEKNDLFDYAYAISFYHKSVKMVKELNKKIKTGILLVSSPVDAAALAKQADSDALVINFNFVDKEVVNKAHKNNLKVFAWNIDTIKDLREMLKLNVDGMGSNKPDVLIEYLKNKSKTI